MSRTLEPIQPAQRAQPASSNQASNAHALESYRWPDATTGASARPSGPAQQDAENRPSAAPPRERWRDQLIVAHYGLVQALAHQMHGRLPRHYEVDDLVSAGTLGLIEAAGRFQADRGVPFSAFARTRIRGAMVDSLRADDWVPSGVRHRAEALRQTRDQLQDTLGRTPSRQDVAQSMRLSERQLARMESGARIVALSSTETPLGADTDLTIGSTLASDTDIVGSLLASELHEDLRAAITRLPEREREAVTLFYLDGRTLEEVGEHLGVTLSRAYQLRNRALERLRYCLQRHAEA